MVESEMTVLGQYRILSTLGHGSFAEVFLAEDTKLGRKVALKVLHPWLLSDPDFLRRFENDARAAAHLDHPHIVTVYDIGQAEGRMYIPMQYCPGGSLADRIARDGPLSFEQAVEILMQIAQALDYAHQLGCLHRDVKPSNILFDAQDRAVLSDFGLVKFAGGSLVTQSSTDGIVGTPAYIAPEVWDDQPATSATDIYALGCVLFEMLTGLILFGHLSTLATAKAHVSPRQFPARWPSSVPPGMDRVLERALSPEPQRRYQTAGELALATQQLVKQGVPKKQPKLILSLSVLGVLLLACLFFGSHDLASKLLSMLFARRAVPAAVVVQVGEQTTPHVTGSDVALTAGTPSVSRDPDGTAATASAATDVTSMPVPATAMPQPLATSSPTPISTVAPTLTPSPRPATETPTATVISTSVPSPTPSLAPLLRCRPVTGAFGAVWQVARDRLGCATGDAITGLVAEEAFEGGMMFWREPFDTAQAVVLFNNGTWRVFGHTPYLEGSPDFSCLDDQTPAQCPPTPKRGFGMMWCDIPEIRGRLGKALNCERGYTGTMQLFEDAFALLSDSGQIYVLYDDGTWERR